MNIYTVFRDEYAEDYSLQEIIVAANSKIEALEVGMKEFNLPAEELGVYDITQEVKLLNKAGVLVDYYW
jgi:hypothetical protein